MKIPAPVHTEGGRATVAASSASQAALSRCDQQATAQSTPLLASATENRMVPRRRGRAPRPQCRSSLQVSFEAGDKIPIQRGARQTALSRRCGSTHARSRAPARRPLRNELRLLWRARCQGLSTGCPHGGGHLCRLEGRQVWLVRDARSDSYTRVHGLATVSAGPVFVVRARLSKIERGPRGGLLMLRSRMLSRVVASGSCRLFSRRGASVVTRRSRVPSRIR